MSCARMESSLPITASSARTWPAGGRRRRIDAMQGRITGQPLGGVASAAAAAAAGAAARTARSSPKSSSWRRRRRGPATVGLGRRQALRPLRKCSWTAIASTATRSGSAVARPRSGSASGCAADEGDGGPDAPPARRGPAASDKANRQRRACACDVRPVGLRCRRPRRCGSRRCGRPAAGRRRWCSGRRRASGSARARRSPARGARPAGRAPGTGARAGCEPGHAARPGRRGRSATCGSRRCTSPHGTSAGAAPRRAPPACAASQAREVAGRQVAGPGAAPAGTPSEPAPASRHAARAAPCAVLRRLLRRLLPVVGAPQRLDVQLLHLAASPASSCPAFSGSGSLRNSPQRLRHDLPRDAEPVREPAAQLRLRGRRRSESSSQKWSTSSCVSQSTTNEMAGVNVNSRAAVERREALARRA